MTMGMLFEVSTLKTSVDYFATKQHIDR